MELDNSSKLTLRSSSWSKKPSKAFLCCARFCVGVGVGVPVNASVAV